VPAKSLDESERKFVDNIREYGWFDSHVFVDEKGPGFSYTTGFWVTLGVPEVIVFSLKQEIAHNILWDIFKDAKQGARRPTGEAIQGIFGNGAAYLLPVAKERYRDQLGWSRWFYGGDEFPCVQLVWPDPAGQFPWREGFDDHFRDSQPDLSEGQWGGA
jgi:hypothetical protein